MRILVTRAKEDAERTAKKLAALGHEALVAPVLQIVPTGDPIPVGSFDAVIVTSIHAVEALSSSASRSIPVFAVGERTADAARARGFTAIMAAEGEAASLSRLIRAHLQPSHTLLHITGRHHKPQPAASLRAAGFQVLTWEVYEAQATDVLPEDAREAFRTGEIGAALHYSRRSADLFVRLAERAGLHTAILACPHFCLSPDVAAPLQALGAATRIAGEPREEALLKLLPSLSGSPPLRLG